MVVVVMMMMMMMIIVMIMMTMMITMTTTTLLQRPSLSARRQSRPTRCLRRLFQPVQPLCLVRVDRVSDVALTSSLDCDGVHRVVRLGFLRRKRQQRWQQQQKPQSIHQPCFVLGAQLVALPVRRLRIVVF